MPMPMEIPRLHSRDTTAPWNFDWLHPVKDCVANIVRENYVPKWESIGAPWTNLDTLSVSYPEPEGLAFKAVRCQCYLTSAVVSPAAQSVMAAGWFGTSRATQATREGVTDLWFKIQSRIHMMVVSWPGELRPGWRKVRTSTSQQPPPHLGQDKSVICAAEEGRMLYDIISLKYYAKDKK